MRHEAVEGDGGTGFAGASAGRTSAEGNTEEGNGGRMGGVARRAARRDGFAGPRGRRRGGMVARGYMDDGAAGWLRGAARERAASWGRTLARESVRIGWVSVRIGMVGYLRPDTHLRAGRPGARWTVFNFIGELNKAERRPRGRKVRSQH